MMLLFEAREKIGSRLAPTHYEQFGVTGAIDQMEADRIAMKSIDAQMRLADLLNDLNTMKDTDTFSLKCVLDFLNEIRFDARFDDDGILISEDEEDGCD